MRRGSGPTVQLAQHFFRRFFENDLVQSEGDTTTTVVRAVSVVVVPEMMVAFFLVNQYPQRSAWGRLEDAYFFVLFSFCVLAGVALFEWDMLFPERLDFLVLTQMPLRGWQMLASKAAALAGFVVLFLVGANGLGIVMLPLISGRGAFLRTMIAVAAAVGVAGCFAALSVLAMGGVLLCVLPSRVFRRVSPLLQMVAVTMLGLLLMQYLRFGDQMESMLRGASGGARWIPTFWFLGVYDRVLHGSQAQAFAGPAERMAVCGTVLMAVVAVLVYPLAWARMRRMAVEGDLSVGRAPVAWWSRMVASALRAPEQLAVFHFIGQTVARNNRYQVYLAMYAGTGLALAISCATTFATAGGILRPALSVYGLHAVLPLLLFWAVAGLRMAFALPLNLQARWVFQCTGADLRVCASATRKWALACGAGVIIVMLGLLVVAGWNTRTIAVQAVCGTCLSVILVDGFFWNQTTAPFTRPRTPGRTSLPAMLTLYVGLLPLFLVGMVHAELRMERSWMALLLPIGMAWLLHVVSVAMRAHFLYVAEDGQDGAESEFQLLGLSSDLPS